MATLAGDRAVCKPITAYCTKYASTGMNVQDPALLTYRGRANLSCMLPSAWLAAMLVEIAKHSELRSLR